MKKDFQVFDLKPGQPVEIGQRMIQLKPTKMFVLPEGATDNKPSFAFILSAGADDVVVAQLTQAMLLQNLPDRALADLRDAVVDEIERRFP